jgi:transcriptional regulator with GAF, ATPase, and Fis domain
MSDTNDVETGIDSGRRELARTFVELADTLVDEFDVVDFLQMLTQRCVDLAGASEVGLLLADQGGTLRVMAASQERSHLLELFQLQNQQGPCLDCYRDGEPVSSNDLEADSDRWPIFAPRAVAAGFRSVQALPLRLRGEVLGALNLFVDHTGGVSHVDQAVAQAMADVATIGLLQERSVRDLSAAADQLRTALQSRVVIEQAKGILAEQVGLDPDAAFQRLRQFARDHNHKLTVAARAVVNGEISGADLG